MSSSAGVGNKSALAGLGWSIRRQPLVEHRVVSIVAPLAAAALLLAAWEITAQFVSPVLISSPQQVAIEFVHQFQAGTATSASRSWYSSSRCRWPPAPAGSPASCSRSRSW